MNSYIYYLNWRRYITSYYPHIWLSPWLKLTWIYSLLLLHAWPCPWPKLPWIYGLLLPPYMTIPMAQIWLPVTPMYGHAYSLNLASCYPYTWSKLTWICHGYGGLHWWMDINQMYKQWIWIVDCYIGAYYIWSKNRR